MKKISFNKDRVYLLKVLNQVLSRSIEDHTADALTCLASSKEKPELISKDKNIVNLLLIKAIKFNIPALFLFLKKLSNFLNYPRNIEILFNSDPILEFMYFCIEDNGISFFLCLISEIFKKNQTDLCAIRIEVVQKFILFLLKSQNGIFYIFNLFQLKETCNFVKIAKYYLTPLLREALTLTIRPHHDDEEMAPKFKPAELISKDFLLNIIHLLAYTFSLVSKKHPKIKNFGDHLVDFVQSTELIIKLLHNAGIAHSTLPEIRGDYSQMSAKELSSKLENNIVLPNGGIFLIELQLIGSLYCSSNSSEPKTRLLMLLSELLMTPQKSKSKDRNDILKQIEKSNVEFKDVFKSVYHEGYFKIGINSNNEKQAQKKSIVRIVINN